MFPKLSPAPFVDLGTSFAEGCKSKISAARLFHHISVYADTGTATTRKKGPAEPGLFSIRIPDLSSSGQFIVGMTNSAPSFTPEGQRDVTVLVLV